MTVDLRVLTEAAVHAPSSHNTQPWLFGLEDDTISLHADRTRALPVNDPQDRELTISCGAALFNLELAAAGHGLEPAVTLLPDPTDPDLLARVTVHRGVDDGRRADDPVLAEAIGRRRSTRAPFTSSTPVDGLAEALASAADQHEVLLHLDVDRAALGQLVVEGDRAQFADPRWRRELASWMHPRRRGDGLAVPEIVGLATRAVVCLVDLGASTASTDSELVTAAPTVAIVATTHDGPGAWIEAGRALQHLLLVATTYGASAGYLNQPCQVSELRPRLQALLPGREFPQVVARLGIAPTSRHRSPRRALDDVILSTT